METQSSKSRYSYEIILIGEQIAEHRNFETTPNFTHCKPVSSKTLESSINGEMIKVNIWEYSYLFEHYFNKNIINNYFHGAVLIFDISEADSLEKNEFWIKMLESVDRRRVPVILVGYLLNFYSQRGFSYEAASEFAHSHGLVYLETLAMNETEIKLIYEMIINQFHKTHSF